MKTCRLLFVGAMALSLIACSATPVRRSFKESVRDSRIKAAVRVKLTKDKFVKARHMEVDVWRGVVTLHGRALTADERLKAEELTKQVKNVAAVENHLQVINEAVAVRTITAQPQGPLTTVVSPAGPTPSANVMAAAVPAPRQQAAKKETLKPVSATLRGGPAVGGGGVVATRGAAAAPKQTLKVSGKELAAVKPVVATSPISINDIRPSSTVSMPTIPAMKPGANPPPKVPATAPAPMARKANGGKTLPWYGEAPDDEAPAMKPSKEISERMASASKTPVSVDEDLAREAADELKRLKGATPR